jgi:hypothetical protein
LGAFCVKRARTNRAFARETEQHLAEAERLASSSTGVERAWLARCADAALTTLRTAKNGPPDSLADRTFPGIESTTLGRRLAAIATPAEPPPAHVRIQIGRLVMIEDMVMSGRAERDLEELLAVIEQLTPAARALIPEDLKDAVIRELAVDPGNTWRLDRFRQALAGEREPYSSVELEGEFQMPTLKKLRRARDENQMRVHGDADAAGRALTEGLALSKFAQVIVNDASVAQAVAAHFERDGFRAALYRRELGTIVTVYDPDHLPRSLDVKGSRFEAEDQ